MTKIIFPNALKGIGGVFLAAALVAGTSRGDEKQEPQSVMAGLGLKISGYAQILGTIWDRDVDSFSLRRARLGLSGEIVKSLKFRVVADLAKSPALLDAVVEYEPSKLIGLRVGQFLVPFSLESTTSTADLDMVNRSSTVDGLAAGRDIGSSGRDIGAALYGSLWIADYTVGVFNGSGINKADTNSHKDISGRVVFRALRFFSLGGSIYRGRQSTTPAEPLLRRNKEGLEAALSISAFSVKSEYIHATDDLISKAGWYVQAGWFALPKKLQALIKYDSLDLDRSVAVDAKNIITLAASWFISGKTKLQVNYEIHGLEGGGREKSGLLAQFQAAF
jgi:phosphate-selective porin